MENVISFTGGKRCISCDEQISPKRLMLVSEARKCIACQSLREDEIVKGLARFRHQIQKEHSSVTIKF